MSPLSRQTLQGLENWVGDCRMPFLGALLYKKKKKTSFFNLLVFELSVAKTW